MEWKLFVVAILLVMVAFGFVLVVGLNAKSKLNNSIGEVNDLNDVKKFLEECRAKPFLDCETILLRKLSAGSNDFRNFKGDVE